MLSWSAEPGPAALCEQLRASNLHPQGGGAALEALGGSSDCRTRARIWFICATPNSALLPVDALPPRCGSIERRSAARKHAGVNVPLATRPPRGPGQLAGSGQSARPRSATGPGEADFRRHSPNAGKQPPAHLLGVFGIAGQFGAQCAVLDDGAPDEERHSEGAERRCEP